MTPHKLALIYVFAVSSGILCRVFDGHKSEPVTKADIPGLLFNTIALVAGYWLALISI